MMEHRITASLTELSEQAKSTAASYLYMAHREIDDEFGVGYALDNPELVAAFMKTCAADMNTTMAGVASQNMAEAISGLGEILDRAVDQMG
jgi:hypothetical protein